jgi:hypothetical protein
MRVVSLQVGSAGTVSWCGKLAARWGSRRLPNLMAKEGRSGFYLPTSSATTPSSSPASWRLPSGQIVVDDVTA